MAAFIDFEFETLSTKQTLTLLTSTQLIKTMQTPKRSISPLTDTQTSKLAEIRKARAFNAEEYVNMKSFILLRYMQKSGLQAAIVAMSGGIDSAVVLGIIHYASVRHPIRPVAVSLPSTGNVGVVDQELGADLSRFYANQLKVEYHSIDINNSVKTIGADVAESFRLRLSEVSPWAYGQLSPYTRTPYLYFVATILKELGYPAIIVGTTNRDEGSYLGYVGKASDGMVDLQLISDLHKSEVRAVAEFLKVPREIIDAVPKGDMFDGKTDEEIFGATYDFVELYASYRDDSEAAQNLEALHKYNAHKYLVGSPAVHLDIQESGVEGGWSLKFEKKFWKQMEVFFPDHAQKLRSLYADSPAEKYYQFNDQIYRQVGLLYDSTKRFFPEYLTMNLADDVSLVLQQIG